jgi:hypothetical protein
MTRILTILLLLLLPCSLKAQIYVAQTAQGADTGADAADAHSVEWFNTPANWGDGTTQIGPGCTVHLCGIVSNPITFQTGGSPSNPITLLFEPNAKLSVATLVGNFITPQSGCTIDGGVNGIIELTANGTGLAYSNDMAAIYISGKTNVTVKNLTIRNLYINIPDQDLSGRGIGVAINGDGCANITVTNCTLHDMLNGIFVVYGAGCHDILYSHCTAYNCNWGGAAGDSGALSTLNGLTVDHCHFYNWQNWETSNNQDHHNGFYTWAESGGWASNVIYSANHVGPGYGYQNTSGMFVTGAVKALLVFNNLFDASDGSSPANAQLNLGIGATTTAFVLNNTFAGKSDNALAMSGGAGDGLTIYYVFNNAFFDDSYAILGWFVVNHTLFSDTNNFYGNPTFNSSGDGTGAFYNFAGWQTYGNTYGVFWDPHSTTSDPLLNGSYQPQAGSALIGAGMNLSSVFTTDYAGNPRPATGAWDVGAYEFQAALSWPAPGGAPWFW